MANNTHWSEKDMRDKGLILVDGKYVSASSQVDKGKVEKLPDLVSQTPTENKKVKNATKTTVDDIVFDSKLEATMYKLLRGAGIEFDRQVVYVLQDKFNYGTEHIRAISVKVDFVLKYRPVIIDTKGLQTQQGAMRYKMLKMVLLRRHEHGGFPLPEIHMPSNKKECDLLLNKLLFGKP